ncbi:cardiac phospholamban isoform X1 [Numida meleagris]|uniref:cardiac phospholamban isoform X1 n=1 Tax=Numida meleagris TaxID=8996 RepID=UPI000B3DE68C|nr:cardiac phospholamban isoform X1 [Numida meleagris]
MTPGALPLELLLFFPSASFSCSQHLVTDSDRLPETRRQLPPRSQQPAAEVVTASWRTNKQAPQRLSKQKEKITGTLHCS